MLALLCFCIVPALSLSADEDELDGRDFRRIYDRADRNRVAGVVELLDEHSHSMLYQMDGSNPAIILYHAPWCSLCYKKTLPAFDKLAIHYFHTNVTVATIDMYTHRSLRDRFGVYKFPTIRLKCSPHLVYEYAGIHNALDMYHTHTHTHTHTHMQAYISLTMAIAQH